MTDRHDTLATRTRGPGTRSATRPPRIVVGVSGATGTVLAVTLLRLARAAGVETHLVVTPSAELTRAYETDMTRVDLARCADVVYRPADVGAAIASGSFVTDGMIVIPCSVRTAAAIASGAGDGLLCRAADVTLKERRPLALVVREAPLSTIHLRNLLTLAEAGASIVPPVPAFYLRPSTVDDLVTHIAARALDALGIDSAALTRWTGPDTLTKETDDDTPDRLAAVPRRAAQA